MPKRNRQSLKECFRQGSRPTQLDFENLIDSSINVLDDGLSKDPETGIALVPVQGKSAVLSVFREAGDERAAWEVSIDPDSGNLLIGRCEGEGTVPVVTLQQDGGLVVGETTGSVTLNGMVHTSARRGSLSGEVKANGRWHDITEELEGCWALEVVAGCGRKNTGKHALIVATAVHCFGARPRITRTSSHYGLHGNKIRLRWKKRGYTCTLQARTTFDYGSDIRIRYYITRLWDAPYMDII